jgi:acetyl esterase/lipase
VSKVSRPTLTVYLPGKAKASGTGIVIFPGGGYVMEPYADEGTSVAQAFQDRGVAAFLVKYRLPDDATMEDKSVGPLQDAQQALRVVRENASEWGVDTAKIGVIGFSAGGHLASTAGTHFRQGLRIDSCRRQLAAGLHGLGVSGDFHEAGADPSRAARRAARQPSGRGQGEAVFQRRSGDRGNSSDTTAACDGRHACGCDNSVQFYQALHRHNVSAEMIVFQTVNHGFLGIPRGEWMEPVFTWTVKNAWAKP